jgi:hypothetical protein
MYKKRLFNILYTLVGIASLAFTHRSPQILYPPNYNDTSLSMCGYLILVDILSDLLHYGKHSSVANRSPMPFRSTSGECPN